MFLFDDGEDGFKSIHILFTSFLLAIVYFCWKSTQVNETLPGVHHLPLGNFVRRSSSVVSNASTTTADSTTEENLTSSVENITDSIFVEASESYNQRNLRRHDNEQSRSPEPALTEEEQIIREMDRDLPAAEECLLRRRNISPDSQPSTSTSSADLTHQSEEDRISIKLKYLNDEVKTVSGYLNETIGNFKRRQFNVELESKLIKLIFNGQILEDDKKSLSQYGLFSQAVVHCLILQKRNPIPPVTGHVTATPRVATNRIMLPAPNPLEWNGTLYIYMIGMALVSVTLVFCWYCRIQYAGYFSWYSTIGLILMTSLFIVMIPLLTLVGFFTSNR